MPVFGPFWVKKWPKWPKNRVRPKYDLFGIGIGYVNRGRPTCYWKQVVPDSEFRIEFRIGYEVRYRSGTRVVPDFVGGPQLHLKLSGRSYPISNPIRIRNQVRVGYEIGYAIGNAIGNDLLLQNRSYPIFCRFFAENWVDWEWQENPPKKRKRGGGQLI